MNRDADPEAAALVAAGFRAGLRVGRARYGGGSIEAPAVELPAGVVSLDLYRAQRQAVIR